MTFSLALWFVCGAVAAGEPVQVSALETIQIPSSKDGSLQPALLWTPDSKEPAPLLVYLHSWSGDYRQKNDTWQAEAVKRGWIYLHPNFRGPNFGPDACGSELARQDVLDAIDHVLSRFPVDRSRIYLAGSSGGGHMSLLMAGYYPERFSAVSAWVGITDLAEWYRFHSRTGTLGAYAKNVVACCGGVPGESPQVDAEYRKRSPIFHLHNVGALPLDINAGVEDGHTGSVPIMHSLNAFNVIAKSLGQPTVSDTEIQQLWETGKLSMPTPGDTAADASYGRGLLLRRQAGATRVTIFEGGHEGLATPGCHWLAQQRRQTKP